MLEVRGINQFYGSSHTLRNVSFTAPGGAVTAVLGRNGVGKTTLLKCLMGVLKTTSGTIRINNMDVTGQPSHALARSGVGYVPQGREIFARLSVEENLLMGLATKSKGRVSDLPQEIFNMFPVLREMLHRRGGDLSGGQQQQLAIGRALAMSPSILILDEPTNDFDIETLNVLEEYLNNYDGGLVVGTYDRYFLDRIVDHLFVFEGKGKIRDFPGNYTDYRVELKEKQKTQAQPKATIKMDAKPKEKPKSESKKLSYKEQREYESLESEIAKLEESKSLLISKLNSGEGSHEELTAWALEIEQIGNQIDTKTERWMELEEQVG